MENEMAQAPAPEIPAPWPAEQVERRALAALMPYARNARTHSPEQVDQIAASIREWGWTMPILVDEAGLILAGHGRALGAAKLGIGEVPIIVARGWSGAEARLSDRRQQAHRERRVG
jgi:ParB-like chromosome segregation protein Spo0J